MVSLWYFDQTMNIFSQIGVIMLIGLVSKNGILIVEFANQKQEAGENKMQAIRDAALQRLRPILMTSASTILGLLPLTFATGEGANQRIAWVQPLWRNAGIYLPDHVHRSGNLFIYIYQP